MKSYTPIVDPADDLEEGDALLINNKKFALLNPTTGKDHSFFDSLLAIFQTGSLNILLIAVPLAFLSKYYGLHDYISFLLSLLSLIPLAERLGFVTEQISLHTGDFFGGLLNVTFGNAVELIFAVAAMEKQSYRLIQLALLGSVLSNILLVLGTSLLYGGVIHKTQSFNKTTTRINISLLIIAVFAVVLPTFLVSSSELGPVGALSISRAVSVILLALYAAYVYFQVKMYILFNYSYY